MARREEGVVGGGIGHGHTELVYTQKRAGSLTLFGGSRSGGPEKRIGPHVSLSVGRGIGERGCRVSRGGVAWTAVRSLCMLWPKPASAPGLLGYFRTWAEPGPGGSLPWSN